MKYLVVVLLLLFPVAFSGNVGYCSDYPNGGGSRIIGDADRDSDVDTDDITIIFESRFGTNHLFNTTEDDYPIYDDPVIVEWSDLCCYQINNDALLNISDLSLMHNLDDNQRNNSPFGTCANPQRATTNPPDPQDYCGDYPDGGMFLNDSSRGIGDLDGDKDVDEDDYELLKGIIDSGNIPEDNECLHIAAANEITTGDLVLLRNALIHAPNSTESGYTFGTINNRAPKKCGNIWIFTCADNTIINSCINSNASSLEKTACQTVNSQDNSHSPNPSHYCGDYDNGDSRIIGDVDGDEDVDINDTFFLNGLNFGQDPVLGNCVGDFPLSYKSASLNWGDVCCFRINNDSCIDNTDNVKIYDSLSGNNPTPFGTCANPQRDSVSGNYVFVDLEFAGVFFRLSDDGIVFDEADEQRADLSDSTSGTFVDFELVDSLKGYAMDDKGSFYQIGLPGLILPNISLSHGVTAEDFELVLNNNGTVLGAYVLDSSGVIHKTPSSLPSLSANSPRGTLKDLELDFVSGIQGVVMNNDGGLFAVSNYPFPDSGSNLSGKGADFELLTSFNSEREAIYSLDGQKNGYGWYVLDSYGGIHTRGAALTRNDFAGDNFYDTAKNFTDMDISFDEKGLTRAYVLDGESGEVHSLTQKYVDLKPSMENYARHIAINRTPSGSVKINNAGNVDSGRFMVSVYWKKPSDSDFSLHGSQTYNDGIRAGSDFIAADLSLYPTLVEPGDHNFIYSITLDFNDLNVLDNNVAVVYTVGDPDADNDGVNANDDLCPNTASGAIVDDYGCSCAQKIANDAEGAYACAEVYACHIPACNDIAGKATCTNSDSAERPDGFVCGTSDCDEDPVCVGGGATRNQIPKIPRVCEFTCDDGVCEDDCDCELVRPDYLNDGESCMDIPNSSCVDGFCEARDNYRDCNDDFDDGSAGDGYEVNVLNDENNCGFCGRTCAQWQSCRMGICIRTEDVCSSNSDCGSGEACEQGLCVESGCDFDSDCDSGEICNANGNCIPDLSDDACSVDTDCDAGKKCSNGSCVSFSCGSCGRVITEGNNRSCQYQDSSCSSNEYCNLGRCVSLTCSRGEIVQNHKCVSCRGVVCGGSCRTGEGECCEGKWNQGIDSCDVQRLSQLELYSGIESKDFEIFFGRAKSSLKAGNIVIARAEAEIAYAAAEIEEAVEEGAMVEEALAILASAKDAYAQRNYETAISEAGNSVDAIQRNDILFYGIIAAGTILLVLAAIGIFLFIGKSRNKEDDFNDTDYPVKASPGKSVLDELQEKPKPKKKSKEEVSKELDDLLKVK